MTDFSLGTYFRYMVQDISSPRHDWMTTPVQDHTVPFHLGISPSVPQTGGTFTMGKKDYDVVRVHEVGDLHNPFTVPVVVVRRIKSK